MTKKEKAKDNYLRREYGISLEEYYIKLKEQNNSCAMCKKHESKFKRSLHVDHNHKSGLVRGLLCFYCNHQLVRKHNKLTAKLLNEYFDKYESEVNETKKRTKRKQNSY